MNAALVSAAVGGGRKGGREGGGEREREREREREIRIGTTYEGHHNDQLSAAILRRYLLSDYYAVYILPARLSAITLSLSARGRSES